MPNKLQTEQSLENPTQRAEREFLQNSIREQVIHALGMPIDLRHVQVRKVWDEHYRVNVLVGSDSGSVKVANSFFLKIDGDGNLVSSTPEITKQY